MCQSCYDEHASTLKDLEGHVTPDMGLWIFIGCIVCGMWAPLITGCYTEHGCGHFCCLAILMWVACFGFYAGYVWCIVWGWTVYQNSQKEHHDKRDVAEEEPLTQD